MRTATQIDIDRPIEEVFRLTNESVSAWSKTCVSEEILNETPDVVGTTFRVLTEDRGQRMEFEGVVTEYDAPRFSRSKLLGKSFDIDVSYQFEDLGGRTRVTQDAQVTGKGFFKVMLALTGWAMKKSSCSAQDDELVGLKRYCEGTAPDADPA